MSTININSVTGIPYLMNTDSYVNGIAGNPTVIIVFLVIIIGYYALFASLGTTTSATISAASAPNEFFFIEILLWSVFIILILLNGMSYFFNFDITAGIKNVFSAQPEIDILVEREEESGEIEPSNAVPDVKKVKEVFHLPGNNYTYDDSKAICSAYGGQLATYKEMDSAYAKGSDWCSYGWSADQMALFPTQYEKWEKLRKIEGHENDCGRPGINGGYIANPNVRFGVNCFGYKPEINAAETKMMNTSTIYPKTAKEIAFDKKVDYWKGKISEIIVSPFNNSNWNIM
jgi:hypothetical protein